MKEFHIHTSHKSNIEATLIASMLAINKSYSDKHKEMLD